MSDKSSKIGGILGVLAVVLLIAGPALWNGVVKDAREHSGVFAPDTPTPTPTVAADTAPQWAAQKCQKEAHSLGVEMYDSGADEVDAANVLDYMLPESYEEYVVTKMAVHGCAVGSHHFNAAVLDGWHVAERVENYNVCYDEGGSPYIC